MTPTEKLIAEARELIEALHAGVYDDEYIGTGAYLMLDELCDALEQAQSTLEQTWEWDMYKAAQKEIERLRKELAALASESVKRDIALAKLEAEVAAAVEAQNAQRWIPVTERLPESGQEVWICEHKRVFHIRWGRDMGFHPSHWMPYIMPQPPKGEVK